MPRPRRLVLILAVLASFALTGTASASAAIVFDAKPGSEAPPATLPNPPADRGDPAQTESALRMAPLQAMA